MVFLWMWSSLIRVSEVASFSPPVSGLVLDPGGWSEASRCGITPRHSPLQPWKRFPSCQGLWCHRGPCRRRNSWASNHGVPMLGPCLGPLLCLWGWRIVPGSSGSSSARVASPVGPLHLSVSPDSLIPASPGWKKPFQSLALSVSTNPAAGPGPPLCYSSVVVTWVTSERRSSPPWPRQPRWRLPTSSHAGLERASEGVHVETRSRVVFLAREKLLWSSRARKGRQNSRKHLLKFSSRKA